jgi:glycosyltransferase involved in cell wall biosynthesis
VKLSPKVLLATCGAWWLPHTAKAFENRDALAGFWISAKNSTKVSSDLYRRCWPFHIAMKPFYHFAPQIWQEKMFYVFLPLWRSWVKSQSPRSYNVIQAIMGYGTELFDKCGDGILKVVDCPNSHPTSFYGYWQRECDLWCPGEKVPIPQSMFARINRDLERADLVLCPSIFVKDTMVLNGIPEAKCFVNPFGVDSQLFKPRSLIPIAPKFICVGTICVRKGYQYLFRAFELVKKVIPNAELICVGDYKRDFAKEKPKWNGLFSHIPHVDHPTLANMLQKCTAFVFPSQEEGFARVISEAMGAGLPIIASYESGATTLVRDGVEGFIVRGRDPHHIAEAMIRVALDSELNLKMGQAAFEKGAAKNTWQDYGDRLLEEYQRRLTTSKHL